MRPHSDCELDFWAKAAYLQMAIGRWVVSAVPAVRSHKRLGRSCRGHSFLS